MSEPAPRNWVKEHIELYLEDPEKGHNWDSTPAGGPGILPALLLVTTGRKSGKPRTLPLIYQQIDGSYVIVASKGGFPKHPVWYLNLVETPRCRIHVGKDQRDAVARTANGQERQTLWEAMAKLYPPYNDYQKRADPREIPVVVLDPV